MSWVENFQFINLFYPPPQGGGRKEGVSFSTSSGVVFIFFFVILIINYVSYCESWCNRIVPLSSSDVCVVTIIILNPPTSFEEDMPFSFSLLFLACFVCFREKKKRKENKLISFFLINLLVYCVYLLRNIYISLFCVTKYYTTKGKEGSLNFSRNIYIKIAIEYTLI